MFSLRVAYTIRRVIHNTGVELLMKIDLKAMVKSGGEGTPVQDCRRLPMAEKIACFIHRGKIDNEN